MGGILIIKYFFLTTLPMPLYVMCLITEDHTHHVCQKYHLTIARSTAIALSVKVAEKWGNIYNTLLTPAALAAKRSKALSNSKRIWPILDFFPKQCLYALPVSTLFVRRRPNPGY